MKYYPAFLDLKGRRVLLLGGGQVALRKATALNQAGAVLYVASKEFSDAFKTFAREKKIALKRSENFSFDPKNFSLVIAATSDLLFNRSVYRKCDRAGVFVNVVDDPKHSTFIVPSLLEQGGLQIAVSTGGASPLLAKLIRRKLTPQFGAEYRRLVAWLAKERKKVKQLVRDQKDRERYFRGLIGSKLKEIKKSMKAGR